MHQNYAPLHAAPAQIVRRPNSSKLLLGRLVPKPRSAERTIQVVAAASTRRVLKCKRPFIIGHPELTFAQLPARDAIATGAIERSGRAPNCSFYTNWINTEDTIYWNVDVEIEGDYQAQVYYTCAEKNLGTVLELRSGDTAVTKKVTQVNDPPLVGEKSDRSPRRSESFMKDFIPLDLGIIHLEKGKKPLILSALEIPGNQSIEMRLIMLNRISKEED